MGNKTNTSKEGKEPNIIPKRTLDIANSIFIDAPEKHEYTLIFLHGLGGDADDIYWIFEKHKYVPTNFRVVLPTAPERMIEN